ncbi:MAG: L-2-hydroxyglutarate oxidase [Candidatus Binatia bacterium]
MPTAPCDVTIIGGGIVGLATALAISERFPRTTILLIEKERELASHQTGHNSGVIHAGIYYKPGSYKAKLCTEGVRLLKQFCEANGVRYENCGKVIVATTEAERPRLQVLYERGTANGVQGIALIDAAGLRDIEPHARAIAALHSPTTAIVDYTEVARAMAANLNHQGVAIQTGTRVQTIRQTDLLHLETTAGTFSARNVINCAGLYSDTVARMMGVHPDVRIIPFRGEYYTLRRQQSVVRGLIYPVPDPEFPFLGVHFTKRIQGDIEAGPNAVLAFAREGYRMAAINPAELFATLTYPGFWAMASKYWRTGIYEVYRSLSKRAFLRALQRLVPELEERDLEPGGAGVRAQAVAADGSLVDDFKISETPHAIHVLNAPSPAATASLAIGQHIADLAAKSFELRA